MDHTAANGIYDKRRDYSSMQPPFFPRNVLPDRISPYDSLLATSSKTQPAKERERNGRQIDGSTSRAHQHDKGGPNAGHLSASNGQLLAGNITTGGGGLKVKDGSKKAAELKKIPCKFFRNNACSAGSACPFSHAMPSREGTGGVEGEGNGVIGSKAVCEYFQKGSCKFGGKCALAHVLPGQSMGMDRKNKRAAAAAAAAQKADDASARTFPDLAGADGGMMMNREGEISRSGDYALHRYPQPSEYRPSLDERPAFSTRTPSTPYNQSSTMPQPQEFESHAVFQSPTRSHPVPVGSRAAASARQGPVAFSPQSGFDSGALSGSPFSPPGRQSVFFSTSSSEQPSNQHSAEAHSLGSESERLRMSRTPSAFAPKQSHSGEVFGNEDLEPTQRDHPTLHRQNERPAMGGPATAGMIASRLDLARAHVDLTDSAHEEDFVPGSLTELLTPHELERRKARQDPSRGGRRAALGMEDMAELNFNNHRPIRPTATQPHGTLGGFDIGTMSGPPALEVEEFMRREWEQRRRLQKESFGALDHYVLGPAEDERNRGSHTLHGYAYQQESGLTEERDRSATALLQSPWLLPIPNNAENPSPSRLALIDSHLPGQSLPEGLAAGLSRLHLRAGGGGVSIGTSPHFSVGTVHEGSPTSSFALGSPSQRQPVFTTMQSIPQNSPSAGVWLSGSKTSSVLPSTWVTTSLGPIAPSNGSPTASGLSGPGGLVMSLTAELEKEPPHFKNNVPAVTYSNVVSAAAARLSTSRSLRKGSSPLTQQFQAAPGSTMHNSREDSHILRQSHENGQGLSGGRKGGTGHSSMQSHGLSTEEDETQFALDLDNN